MVTLIDDITAARDKAAPIRALGALLREHPELDVHQYLQRMSAAFRRFVLDTLAREDEGDGAAPQQGGLGLGLGGDEKENTGSKPSGTEAMRILDGIRARQSFGALRPATSDNNPPNPTPNPASSAGAKEVGLGVAAHVPAALLPGEKLGLGWGQG